MKTLIVYYSYGHHTRDVAEIMKKALGCDLSEIVPVKAYTGVYQKLVDATVNNPVLVTSAVRSLEINIPFL